MTLLLRNLFLTFFMSMLPVVELRGSIPFGTALGLPVWAAFLVSAAGNMVPTPFIMLFARRIFLFLSSRCSFWKRLADKIERRTLGKARIIYRYQLLGLCILVAIPLPGTGAWTGALLAALMNIRMRNALPAVFLGVVIAGILVSLATYGVAALSWAAGAAF